MSVTMRSPGGGPSALPAGVFESSVFDAASRGLDWAVSRRLDALEQSDPGAYRVVKHCIDFVDDRLADSITITQMSRAAATSVSKLERTFRRELGVSPSRYILVRRLTRARALLRQSPSSVASVAMDCGFRHLGRFSGAYRRQFGELPSETLGAA